MSSNNFTTRNGRKSTKDKLCKAISRHAVSKNLLEDPISFTPRDLIQYLAIFDSNWKKYFPSNITSKGSKLYWNENLKSAFHSYWKRKYKPDCIQKLDKNAELTLDSKLRHVRIRSDNKYCPAFLHEISKKTEKQSVGGMGEIIATWNPLELKNAVRNSLLGLLRMEDTTHLPNDFFKLLNDIIFRDLRKLYTHGVKFIIRGNIYHNDYNTGRKPNSVEIDGTTYYWSSKAPRWELNYSFDYSGNNNYVGILYEIDSGTISITMQEVEVGYCLDDYEFTRYKRHILKILSLSLEMGYTDKLLEISQFDINQDVPVELIYPNNPEIIQRLKYLSPDGKYHYIYDFKYEMKGSALKIYYKNKVISGRKVEFIRFELVSKSTKSTQYFDTKRNFVDVITYFLKGSGDKFGIENVQEYAKTFNLNIDEIFDNNPLPFILLNVMGNQEKNIQNLTVTLEQSQRNTQFVTITNSQILLKLADELNDLKDIGVTIGNRSGDQELLLELQTKIGELQQLTQMIQINTGTINSVAETQNQLTEFTTSQFGYILELLDQTINLAKNQSKGNIVSRSLKRIFKN